MICVSSQGLRGEDDFGCPGEKEDRTKEENSLNRFLTVLAKTAAFISLPLIKKGPCLRAWPLLTQPGGGSLLGGRTNAFPQQGLVFQVCQQVLFRHQKVQHQASDLLEEPFDWGQVSTLHAG